MKTLFLASFFVMLSSAASAAGFLCTGECTFYKPSVTGVYGTGSTSYSASADAAARCNGTYTEERCVQTPDSNFRCNGICDATTQMTETITWDSEVISGTSGQSWYCKLRAEEIQMFVKSLGASTCRPN